ncbi:MAG: FAD-dependent thymidylate synthase [Victivallaceae bacterium]
MSFLNEEFSDRQKELLSLFVTNLDKNVFGIKNLPEVVKGALFSRYSRSVLGLRSLLLKEFIENEEVNSFNADDCLKISEDSLKKASSFYERVLDSFGDDSIGELGGAHLAMEGVSVLAAKILEDARIGGSPLEKSTRYVYFDQKVNGVYLYYRDPVIMTSAFKDVFLKVCDSLFDAYSKLIPQVISFFEKCYTKPADVSSVAYKTSIRAKVLDCLRGLLPASTLTNLGFFGNGRFWQTLVHKMLSSDLSEVKDLGLQSLEALRCIIPSFVVRAEPHHKHHQGIILFFQTMKEQLKNIVRYQGLNQRDKSNKFSVKLVYDDPKGVYKTAAALLFPYSDHPYEYLIEFCENLPKDKLTEIFEAASSLRENRRHKSPRGLECCEFGFDILADFGAYRDLQRHRILTQERQLLTANHGYFFPEELLDTPMEKTYRKVMDEAREAYELMSEDFPEESQYIVPMAYNIRWIFHINLRSLQWLCELRSMPQGHTNYRHIAQEMASEVIKRQPLFEHFFKFVNYEREDLGRIHQEAKGLSK